MDILFYEEGFMVLSLLEFLSFIEETVYKEDRLQIHEDFMYPQQCQFRINKNSTPYCTIITTIEEFDIIKKWIGYRQTS